MDILAKRIKYLRERLKEKESKYTQGYVADIIGVARSTYTAYENGTKQPPMETVNKIADFFNVSVDYLIGRSDDPRLTEDQQKEVDEEFQELKKIIESLPEEEQEKVKRMVIGYVKGYADSLDRKENKRSE